MAQTGFKHSIPEDDLELLILLHLPVSIKKKKNYEVKQQQWQHPYQMEKSNDDNNIAPKEAKGNRYTKYLLRRAGVGGRRWSRDKVVIFLPSFLAWT